MLAHLALTALLLAPALALAPAPAFAPAPAQDPDAAPAPDAAPEFDVLVYPNWSVGDRYLLELVKARKSVRDGEVEQDRESRREVLVSVVGEDATSFLIEWRFSLPVLPEDMPEDVAAFAAPLIEAMRDFVIRFRTDEYGSFASIENTEEVSEALGVVFDAIGGRIKQEADGSELPEGLSALLDSFRDGGLMLQSAASEVAPYYMASGLGLDVGVPQEYADVLPNLLGGPDFPSHASWLAESVDPEAQTARIAWRQTIDGEHASEAIVATFEALSARMGQRLDEAELPPLSIDDKAVFEYDLELGLPREARYVRRVVIADRLQVDELRYRLLEFPAELPDDAASSADSEAPEER